METETLFIKLYSRLRIFTEKSKHSPYDKEEIENTTTDISESNERKKIADQIYTLQ